MKHVTIQKPTDIRPMPTVHRLPEIAAFTVRLDGSYISVNDEGQIVRLEGVEVDLILDANELRTLSDRIYATMMRHAPELPGVA